MSPDMRKARELLRSGGYTCVLVKDQTVYHSYERGVKPLLSLLDSGADLRGFSAADKVIGKATAYLYCLLGVGEVYAPVISESAAEVLSNYGIPATWEQKVPLILNRRKTAGCPMETAVQDIHEAADALIAIRETLRKLN